MALPAPTIALATEAAVEAVRITVGVPAGTERLDVYRVGPSGVQAYVRQAFALVVTAAPGSLVLRDFEVPLGVPVTYTARVYKADGSEASTASAPSYQVDPPSKDPWLTDIIRPLNSQPVTVESFGPLGYEQPLGLHRVLERRAPVVTADLAWTPGGELVFCTLDEPGYEKARDCLGNGVPVLLRTLPEQGPGNVYLVLTGWTIERVTRVATRPERRFKCQTVQIDRPDARVFKPRPPLIYTTLLTKYGTYASVKAAGTYDAVLYDYAAGTTGAVEPWPPADV